MKILEVDYCLRPWGAASISQPPKSQIQHVEESQTLLSESQVPFDDHELNSP